MNMSSLKFKPKSLELKNKILILVNNHVFILFTRMIELIKKLKKVFIHARKDLTCSLNTYNSTVFSQRTSIHGTLLSVLISSDPAQQVDGFL